jgi:hypothetical protein
VVPEAAGRRLTEGVGAVAEAEVQAGIGQAQRGRPIAPPPVADGAARPPMLVVEGDGIHAPLRAGWSRKAHQRCWRCWRR